MADVFAELIANASINMVAFDAQLMTLKNKLAEVKGISLSAENSESLKQLNEDAKIVGDSLGDVSGEMENLTENSESFGRESKRNFDKASVGAEKFGRKGSKAGKDVKVSLGGITGAAAKAVAVMGTVELGLGVANVAASALTGNFEDAAESLKKLPAGIGPVATQLEGVLNLVTGIKDETDTLIRTTEMMNAAMSKRLSISSLRFKQEQQGLKDILSLRTQLLISQMELIGLYKDEDVAKEIARKGLLSSLEGQIADILSEIDAVDVESGVFTASTSEDATKEVKNLSEATKKYKKQLKEIEKQESAIASHKEHMGLYPQRLVKDLEKMKEELARLKGLQGAAADLVKTREKELDIFKERKKELKEQLDVATELADMEMKAFDMREKREQDAFNKKGKEIRDENNRESIEEALRAGDELVDLLRKAAENAAKEKDDAAKKVADMQAKLDAEAAAKANALAAIQAADIAKVAAKAKDTDAPGPERTDLRSRFEDSLAALTKSDKDAKIGRQQAKTERRAEKQLDILDKIRKIGAENKDILKNINFDPRFQ
jgi:hypothetical protein